MPRYVIGQPSIGVRQFLMKSRDTLYGKSGCTAYRLCRYFSITSVGHVEPPFDEVGHPFFLAVTVPSSTPRCESWLATAPLSSTLPG
jgi:hypothetical protein